MDTPTLIHQEEVNDEIMEYFYRLNEWLPYHLPGIEGDSFVVTHKLKTEQRRALVKKGKIFAKTGETDNQPHKEGVVPHNFVQRSVAAFLHYWKPLALLCLAEPCPDDCDEQLVLKAPEKEKRDGEDKDFKIKFPDSTVDAAAMFDKAQDRFLKALQHIGREQRREYNNAVFHSHLDAKWGLNQHSFISLTLGPRPSTIIQQAIYSATFALFQGLLFNYTEYCKRDPEKDGTFDTTAEFFLEAMANPPTWASRKWDNDELWYEAQLYDDCLPNIFPGRIPES